MDGLTLLWGTIVSFGALLAWLINIARNDPALLRELARAFARPVVTVAILAAGPLLYGLCRAPAFLRTDEAKIALAVFSFTAALLISSGLLGRIAKMPPRRKEETSARARRATPPEEGTPSQQPASSRERLAEDARDPH
ncbi:MAG: hypothetical protein J0H09_09025 [Burkholderiales bacterium]|nr:hypothetical protein [Burkholderiales bacterium]